MMELTSTAFVAHAFIPERYTCDGENESPPLTITGVPEGTQSLILIAHDPDAIKGDFVHWTMWNINPATQEFKAGLVPDAGIEGKNDAGGFGYTGPCPPVGTGIHHYHFVLIAADMTIALPSTSTRDELLMTLEGHELGRAMLVGLYQRQ
jgi:Raf kinase inhibitor-like YbhB/YbcL family protein